MLKPKSNRRFVFVTFLMASFFATQAFAGTSPTAAIRALRKALNPKMAKQGKELSGTTPDQHNCKVDLTGVNVVDSTLVDDPVSSNVISVSLNITNINDSISTVGVFDLDMEDEVKSLKSDENSISISATVQNTEATSQGVLGLQEVSDAEKETKVLAQESSAKESITIEMNQGRIASVAIMNDKDQYRCNVN
jgi:hypothetical protein